LDGGAYVSLIDNGGIQHTLSGSRIVSQSGTAITVDPDFTSLGAGTWRVEVINGSGLASGYYSFQVAPVAATPTISSVSPAEPQATDGDQNFTIYGSNFDSGAYVSLIDNGGVQHALSGSRIVSQSATAITVDPNFTSLGAGTWQVQVVNPIGTTSSWFSFQVVAPAGVQSGVDYNVYGNGATATVGVDLSGIKAAGKKFVGEYIGTADNFGYLRPADVEALTAEGLQIVSLFERSPTSASYFTLANADFDAADAINAAEIAGQPPGSAIYFTVDFDPGTDQASLSAIDNYFREIRKDFDQYLSAHPGVKYDIGVYAAGDVLPTIMNDATVGASYSWLAEPFGPYPYPTANLAQTQDSTPGNPILIGNIQVDLDEAYTVNFGQWNGSSGSGISLSITAPTNAATYSTTNGVISLSGSASGGAGVNLVLWINAQTGGAGTAIGTTAWSANEIGLAIGSNVITVIAYDAAGDQSAATLTVTYTPISAAVISLDGALTFEAVPVGSTVENVLMIRNTGTTVLNVTSLTCPSGFSGSFAGGISPGGFNNVLISFAPTLPASYAGTIVVTSDAGGGSHTIAVSGSGLSTNPILNPPIAIGVKIQAGNALLTTWPTNARGFQLEFATDLGPSAIWTPVGTTAGVVNGRYAWTNAVTGQRMFFRLHQ
jgi:hypothetical protein